MRQRKSVLQSFGGVKGVILLVVGFSLVVRALARRALRFLLLEKLVAIMIRSVPQRTPNACVLSRRSPSERRRT
jgi:hypothetical protein